MYITVVFYSSGYTIQQLYFVGQIIKHNIFWIALSMLYVQWMHLKHYMQKKLYKYVRPRPELDTLLDFIHPYVVFYYFLLLFFSMDELKHNPEEISFFKLNF